jgi:IS30 family transposase
MLVNMNDTKATSAVEGFSAALNRMPVAAHNTITDNQGREMARHAGITPRTGVAIDFLRKPTSY